ADLTIRCDLCGGRRRLCRSVEFNDHDLVALIDLVPQFDAHFLDSADLRRRHFHGRLVGFNRDQALFELDTVADGDHDLDLLYVGRLTDIGHDHRGLTTRARTALLCSVRRLGGRGLLGPCGRWLRGWNRRFVFFG